MCVCIYIYIYIHTEYTFIYSVLHLAICVARKVVDANVLEARARRVKVAVGRSVLRGLKRKRRITVVWGGGKKIKRGSSVEEKMRGGSSCPYAKPLRGREREDEWEGEARARRVKMRRGSLRAAWFRIGNKRKG